MTFAVKYMFNSLFSSLHNSFKKVSLNGSVHVGAVESKSHDFSPLLVCLAYGVMIKAH